MIRRARIDDLERLTEIYNQAILSKKSTAHMEIFTADDRKDWFSQNNNERTPIFVYEHDNIAVGYCYLSEYRGGRKAFESTAEISYYVDFNYHQKGIGSKLVQHTITIAKKLEYKNLVAVLLNCNEGSVALLSKFGFKEWGFFPDIAYIGDNVYSQLHYGLKLK